MKKHLIAAAVAGTLAVPAMAQVSLSGRLDAGYGNLNSNQATGDRSGFQYSGDTTSRLTFKANEDLGGGMKAYVHLEQQVGNVQNGDSAAGFDSSFEFDRAMYVGISGGFGKVSVGYQNSIDKNIIDGYQVGGANNTLGKLADVVDNEDSRNHSLRYDSPSFGGLTVNVEVENAKDDGDKTGTGTAFGISYSAGPLKAAIASAKETNNDASNYDTTQTSVGVSYNMGMATVLASYLKTKKEAATDDEQSGYEIGVRVPMGSLALFASYATATEDAAVDLDSKAMQVGARYALSKRTNLYIIHGTVDRDTSASASTDRKHTTMGLVHKF